MPPPLKKKTRKSLPWLRWVLLGLVLAGVGYVMSGPTGILHLREMARENATKRAAMDTLTAHRQDLLREKQRLTSDSAYIEAVARRELGMARPGEKVYRFMEKPAKP
jgi:cell division protein FtsB